MTRPLQQVKFGALAALMAASTVSSLFNTAQVNAAVDCTSDAIIRCGVTYTTQQQGLREIKRDIERNRGMYRISKQAQDYLSTHGGEVNIAEGRLYENGVITVGGEVVARESHTFGRFLLEGRNPFMSNGETYYRAPAREFVAAGEYKKVYVALTTNGEYIAAVVQTCGNPVDAEAVKQPTPPKPETPKPEPQAPVTEKPTPVTSAPAQPVAQPVVQKTADPVVAKGTPEAIASTGLTDVFAKGLGVSTVTALLAYALTARRRLF